VENIILLSKIYILLFSFYINKKSELIVKMVDMKIVEYLRKYRGVYDIEILKKKILATGYSQVDLDQALIALNSEPVAKYGVQGIRPQVQPQGVQGMPGTGVKPQEGVGVPLGTGFAVPPGSGIRPQGGTGIQPVSSRPITPGFQGRVGVQPQGGMGVQPQTGMAQPGIGVQPAVNPMAGSGTVPGATPGSALMGAGTGSPLNSFGASPVKKFKKGAAAFKIAGIAAILSMLLILPGFFLLDIVGQSLLLAGCIFTILFYVGFLMIGKRYNKTLLYAMSWIFVIFFVALIGMQIFEFVSPASMEFSLTDLIGEELDFNAIKDHFMDLEQTTQIILYSMLGLWVIISILFGVGLIGLKNDVKLSKATGILIIIGAITLAGGLGVLLLFIARILEAVILFKE